MDRLEMAEQAIKKGERTKLLFEILMSELGMSFENTSNEVFTELKRVQEDYHQAIANMAMLLHEGRLNTKRHQEDDVVKGPNYIADLLEAEGHINVTKQKHGVS